MLNKEDGTFGVSSIIIIEEELGLGLIINQMETVVDE